MTRKLLNSARNYLGVDQLLTQRVKIAPKNDVCSYSLGEGIHNDMMIGNRLTFMA